MGLKDMRLEDMSPSQKRMTKMGSLINRYSKLISLIYALGGGNLLSTRDAVSAEKKADNTFAWDSHAIEQYNSQHLQSWWPNRESVMYTWWKGNISSTYFQEAWWTGFSATLGAEAFDDSVLWKLKLVIANLENEWVALEITVGEELKQYLLTGQINVSDSGTLKLTVGALERIMEFYNKEVSLRQYTAWIQYTQGFDFGDVLLRAVAYDSKWKNLGKVSDVLNNSGEVIGYEEGAFTWAQRVQVDAGLWVNITKDLKVILEAWYFFQKNKNILGIKGDTTSWARGSAWFQVANILASTNFEKWRNPWYKVEANLWGWFWVYGSYNEYNKEDTSWGISISFPLDKKWPSQGQRRTGGYRWPKISPVAWTNTYEVYGKFVKQKVITAEDAPTEKGAPIISEITPTSVQWENGIKDKDGIRNIRFFLIVGTSTTPLESDTWLFENISPDTPCSMYTTAETYNILTGEWNKVESEKTSFRTSEVPFTAPTFNNTEVNDYYGMPISFEIPIAWWDHTGITYTSVSWFPEIDDSSIFVNVSIVGNNIELSNLNVYINKDYSITVEWTKDWNPFTWQFVLRVINKG